MPNREALLTRDALPPSCWSHGTGRPRREPSAAPGAATGVTASPALAVGQASPRRRAAARPRFSAARARLRTGPLTPGSIRADAVCWAAGVERREIGRAHV